MLHFRGIVLVHLALDTRLGAGFFKHQPHDWVFVFILDLIAAELHIHIGLCRRFPIDPVENPVAEVRFKPSGVIFRKCREGALGSLP